MSDLSQQLEVAAQLLGPRVERDANVAALTTYRVGGRAALSFHVDSLADLWHVSMVMSQVEIPVTVIGRGSNVLVSDDGFPGLVITLGDFANDVALPTDRGAPGESAIARFGGAVALPVASRQSVAHGLTGFEWAVGVPGSIGGAVRMNAGGHGSDMATNLSAVRLFHLRKGPRTAFSRVGADRRPCGAVSRSPPRVGIRCGAGKPAH